MFRIARDSCVEVDPPEVLENLEKPAAETRQEGASMTTPQEEQENQHFLHHQHQMVEVPVLEISSSSSASPVSVEVEVEVDHDNDAGQLQAQPPDEEASRGGAAAALSTSKQDLLSSSSSSVELLPVGSRSTAYDPVAVVARQQDLVLVNAGSVIPSAAADRAQATVGQAEQQRATERTAPAARSFSPPAGGGKPAAKKTPDEASPKWTSIEEARRSYQREKINRKSQEEQRKSVEGLLPQGPGGGPGPAQAGRASFQSGRQSFGEGGDQDDYHDSGVQLQEQVVQQSDVEDDSGSADAREQVQLFGKSQEQSSSSSQPAGMVTSQKSGAVAFSVPFGSTAAPAAETNKTAGGAGSAGANHPHPVGASSAPPVKIVPDHLPVTTRVEPNPNFFATATEEQKARRRSLSSDSARQQHKSPVGNIFKQAVFAPQKSLDNHADGAASTGTAALQAGSSTRRLSFEAPSRTTSSIDPKTGEKVVIRRNQAPYAVRRTVTRSRSPQMKSRDGIATSSNPMITSSSSSSSGSHTNNTSRQEQLIGPREGLAMSAGGGVLLVSTDGDPHDRRGEDAYIKDASSKETILVASRRSGDHVDHVLADETDKNDHYEALELMQDELRHRDSQEDLHQDNSNLFGNTLTYSMDSDMKLGISCAKVSYP